MKTYPVLGAHVPFEKDSINVLYSQGFRNFQFFIGPPSAMDENYEMVKTSYPLVRALLPQDINLIAHGKFTYNFVKGDELTERTLASMRSQLEVCKLLGIKTYVTHVGAMHSQKEKEEGIIREESDCMQNWIIVASKLSPELREYGIKLCFENTPGVKAGTYMGSIEQILTVLKTLNDYDHYGYCLDTQHAWANGEVIYRDDKKLFYDDVILRASVIHINGNEQKCDFGAHRDRHSKTLTTDSWCLPFAKLKRVFEIAECPLIFERDSISMMLDEKTTLEKELSNG